MARDRSTGKKREPDGSQNDGPTGSLVQRGRDPSASTAPGRHQKVTGVRGPRKRVADDAPRATRAESAETAESR